MISHGVKTECVKETDSSGQNVNFVGPGRQGTTSCCRFSSLPVNCKVSLTLMLGVRTWMEHLAVQYRLQNMYWQC